MVVTAVQTMMQDPENQDPSPNQDQNPWGQVSVSVRKKAKRGKGKRIKLYKKTG